MKIRRPDGYIIDCDCGCRLHFYDGEIFVCKHITNKDFPLIPLEEWYDLPFNEALEYTQLYKNSPIIKSISCYIRCPECETHWRVWNNVIFTTKYFNEEDSSKPVNTLIKEGQIVISSKQDMDAMGVKLVHGSEEEI